MIQFSSRLHLPVVVLLLCVWMALWGCAYGPAAEAERDPAAEALVARLKAANTDLTRFKCLGKMTLAAPGQPAQSFRAAFAGALNDCFRIDMFAPFGGSAGSFSSDGKHLFLVRHPSGEYYKKRFGNGNLQRLLKIHVSISDLLEVMMGRIPIDEKRTARLIPGSEDAGARLIFIDRKGRTRQKISVDTNNTPLRSEWFDSSRRPTHALVLKGRQVVDGYSLPRRIDLNDSKGDRVTVVLERYEANVPLDNQLFSLPEPRS